MPEFNFGDLIEEEKEEKKEEKREICQYCGKDYSPNYISTHEKKCPENPEKKEKSKRPERKEISGDYCSECGKKATITQDKSLNKDQIIENITNTLKDNKEVYTQDFLRSMKMIYDSLFEMRK